MRDLHRVGFVNRGGKGSHRNFSDEFGHRVTLSGQENADAKPYQEKEVTENVAKHAAAKAAALQSQNRRNPNPPKKP